MGPPLTLETTFARREPRLAKLTLALNLLWVLALLGVAPASGYSGLLAATLSAVFVASGLGAWLAFRKLDAPVPGEVRVDADGVRLGPELVPRAAIRAAYFVPRAGGASGFVALLGEGELGRIDVVDHAQADRVLAALDRAPSQRTAPFGVVAPARSSSALALLAAMIGGLALFAVSLPLHLTWLGALAMMAAIAAPIVFVNATVHVGADGLLLSHRLGERFLPWAEVESIDPYPRGVVVKTRAEALHIPITSHFRLYHDHEREAQGALITRARDALAAHRRGDPVDTAARLSRRGRPLGEWIRGLLDRDGDFRSAPVPEDRLWQVVESSTATPTARAGAAAVLMRGAEEQGRARLRIAADACASPRLRVVLDKAASGAPEEEVHAALAEVEDEAEAEEEARTAAR